jgi:hypothetical protein
MSRMVLSNLIKMKNQESKMEFGSDLKALYPDFMDVLNHVLWSQNLCLDYMMSYAININH